MKDGFIKNLLITDNQNHDVNVEMKCFSLITNDISYEDDPLNVDMMTKLFKVRNQETMILEPSPLMNI